MLAPFIFHSPAEGRYHGELSAICRRGRRSRRGRRAYIRGLDLDVDIPIATFEKTTTEQEENYYGKESDDGDNRDHAAPTASSTRVVDDGWIRHFSLLAG